jgi:hypothetical protein
MTTAILFFAIGFIASSAFEDYQAKKFDNRHYRH